MNPTTPNSTVPSPIVHKLQLVRKRKVWLHVASAIVTAVAVLLAAMGLAMLIDWLATLYDSRWRVVLTMAAISAAAATAIGWLVVARRRLFAINQIAGDVDRQIPQLEERWTTITRLGEDASDSSVIHPAMLRRVSKEAVSFEPHVEPEQVVPVSVLMRSMIGLTAITAVLGIAVVMNTSRTWVLMKRFWAPSSLISATELVNLPGDVVIGRGEPLELTAAVDGIPVDRATLFLQPENDEPRTVKMVAHGTDPIEFKHRLRSVEQPFEYRFRAGDGQSEWHSVSVADRPEIEKLLLTVTPPAYTRKETKTFERLPQRVTTIQKSKLELAIRPKVPVQTVELQLGGDKKVMLTAADDGWYRWETTLDEGFDFTPVLTESHGLQNRRPPKCSVSVYPDRPPAVKVLTPDDQMAVRPGETIPVTFSASDDVGIESAELLVYDESAAGSKTEPIATIPIDLGDQQGEKLIRQSVDLELSKFAAEDGAEISYEIRVREDRGTSQTSMANQTAGNSAAQASPSTSNASMQQTATAQIGGQSQGDTSPREGQADSNLAQSQPQSPTENTAKESGRNASGQPAKDTSPSNDTVAQSSAQPGQPSASNGNKTPPAASSQSAQAESTTAKTSPPSETPQSPSATGEKTPTPPANSLASNMTRPDGEAKIGANTGQKSPSSASQSSPGQASQSASSQKSATPSASSSTPNPTAQNQAAQNQSTQGQMAQSNAGSSPSSSSKSDSAKTQTSGSAPSSNQTAQKSPEKPGEPAAPREATSGRKGFAQNQMASKGDQPESNSTAESKPNSAASNDESAKMAASAPAANPQSKPMESKPAESKQAQSKQSKAAGSQQANQNNSSRSNSQMASNSQPNSSSESQPSNDNMPKRMLDVPEPSSNTSKRMRLKIDELAGSFSGQQRAKLEMAIGPELEALDKALAKGQRTARGVLDQLEADAEWRGTHDRDVSGAERATVEAQEVIGKLQQRSKDTPYAFVGLQVADIGLAHVDPARSDFWKALQSEGGDRAGSVRDGWQHLGRARELVAELRGQYERAKRDFQLAESVEKFKTMYQVFIENTQALLPTEAQDPDRYNRKGVEFKLDEEYLARLKEVLEMRRDLQAELARILADDPRLLRRFMDSTRNRTNNLREELADLAAEQEDLNREVRAWSLVEEADRPRMARLLMLRQVQDATKISTAAGELQSRHQAWMPLGQESKDPEVAAATKLVQDVATAAGQLSDNAHKFVAESQRVKAAQADSAKQQADAEAAPAEGATADAAQQQAQPAEPSLDPLLADGQRLYDQLSALDVSMRQLAAREDGGEAATFAANRLVDTRRLIADTSAWVRQMRAHNSGNYSGAAEVDQYRLAMKTDSFATKLSALEQSLAGGLQRQDGTLPEAIAKKSRELMTTLDREAAPNQLAAVYALHSNQTPRATERQKSAGTALAKAQQQYDELMRLAIAEMDKLPVQDPIASLLQDPTLDEILAELEQELPIQELLGIPLRPSNLRIIGDWLRPNVSPNGSGVGAQTVTNQMRQDQQRMRRRLDEAYKRALARALKEEKKLTKVEIPKTTMSDWNKLVSELGDDIRQGRDKLPPEQYRRAIEQYFAEISKAVADREKQAK